MERGKAEPYVLAGPAHSMVEVYQTAASITGRPVPKIQASAAVLNAAARVVEKLERFIPLPPTFRAESLRAVAGVSYTASSAKARDQLGFDPRPLREGLSQTLQEEMQALGG